MVLSSADLRALGRELSAPFEVELDADGRIQSAQCVQVLRLVPERRVVVKMLLDEQVYLGKLFLDSNRAKYIERERSGVEAMHDAGVDTAVIRGQARLSDNGAEVLLLDYLPAVRHLSEGYAVNGQTGTEYLKMAVGMMARLHQQGLLHQDCHLGNFLISDDRLYLVDGDAVQKGATLSTGAAIQNLALFVVQLPLHLGEKSVELFACYCQHRGWAEDSYRAMFQQAVEKQRSDRQRRFLKKAFRDCTQFKASKSWARFAVVDRQAETAALQSLLERPDHYIEAGELLKDGNSATVAKVQLDGMACVVKRYNIKGFGHWLSRFWRPSRAWLSWRNAQLLQFYQIDTPKPLALLEERCGPFRGRAYFISECLAEEDALAYARKMAAQPPALAVLSNQFADLFKKMALLKLSHGDFKATNFLMHGGGLSVIDLDSMRLHRSAQSLEKALAKDKRRFMKNWTFDSTVESAMLKALEND